LLKPHATQGISMSSESWSMVVNGSFSGFSRAHHSPVAFGGKIRKRAELVPTGR
jgi:hypothetical protein